MQYTAITQNSDLKKMKDWNWGENEGQVVINSKRGLFTHVCTEAF